jgi:hypothetical protein
MVIGFDERDKCWVFGSQWSCRLKSDDDDDDDDDD